MSANGRSSPSNSDRKKAPAEDEARQIHRALKYCDDKAAVLKPYLRAARWISPAIHPYAALTSVFFTGLEKESSEDDDTSQGAEIDEEEELNIYKAIMKLHPSFEDVVTACSGHKHALHNLIHMLENQSRSARNSDVSSLNGVICEFIKEDASRLMYNEEEFPIPAKTNLQERGWNHPLFAVLLYPMSHFEELCNDPNKLVQAMTDIDNAVIDVSESEWPTFLYESGINPDPDDDRYGLFRGNLLPIAFRHTFTSPQSALQPSVVAKGRLNKARLHNLTEVTGRTIAYICVLVRIALRGRGWVTEDGAFEYEAFYQNIVRMFEDNPKDSWVIETLDWWNEQVPGLAKSLKTTKKKKKAFGPDGRIRDPVARSAAQRAAKDAKAANARAARDVRSTTPATTANSVPLSTPTAAANSERLSTTFRSTPPFHKSSKGAILPRPTATANLGESSTAGSSTGLLPRPTITANLGESSTAGSSTGPSRVSATAREPSPALSYINEPSATPNGDIGVKKKQPLPIQSKGAITTVVTQQGRKIVLSDGDSELTEPEESEDEVRKGCTTKKRKTATLPKAPVRSSKRSRQTKNA